MQATKRIADVVGPACTGSGDCAKVMQLSVGRLLELLTTQLMGAVKCDGAEKPCGQTLEVCVGGRWEGGRGGRGGQALVVGRAGRPWWSRGGRLGEGEGWGQEV